MKTRLDSSTERAVNEALATPLDSEGRPDYYGGGCRVFWGSHGCQFERGHEGLCECDCCECLDHAVSNVDPEYENVICVAKPPYYGPETTFYGEDVAARGLPEHRTDGNASEEASK